MVDQVTGLDTLSLTDGEVEQLTDWHPAIVLDYTTTIRNLAISVDGINAAIKQININTTNIQTNADNIQINADNIQINAGNFADHINQSVEPDPHPQYQMKQPGLSLFGTVDNFTFDTTPSKLINYSDSDSWAGGDASDLDPSTGEITIPEDGLYKISAFFVGTQGNVTTGQEMKLQVDVNSTKQTVSVFDVSSGVSSERTFDSSLLLRLSQSDVVSLFCVATANMGTFTSESSTFEVVKVA